MTATKTPQSATGRRTTGALTQVGTEVSINLGSALAGLAIPIVGSTLVVAVRQLVMVLVVAPFYRPSRASFTWHRVYPAILLGIVLAIMNLTFYQSVHLLGLGIAATIEFLGPLTLALVLSRRILDFVCVAVAALGVLALTGFDGDINLWGVVLALIAAAAWAAYILLTRRVALSLPGLEGLTVASVVSLLIIGPMALLTVEMSTLSWPVIALLLGIGVLSSALPYSLDTYILRRITARLYAIITSCGPVVAAIFGWLVLSETLTLIQIAAILLVCAAAATAIATQRDVPQTALEETSPHII
jgi:inner membrane transporter RhtA